MIFGEEEGKGFDLYRELREKLDEFVTRYGGSLPLSDVLSAAGILLVDLALENEVELEEILKGVSGTYNLMEELSERSPTN